MKKVMMSMLCLSIAIAAAKAQDRHLPAPPVVAPAPLPNSVPPPPEAIDPNAGSFNFEETTHDYGTVPEGPKAEYDFEFKNTGKKPITISNAAGSCGCTVPSWPHEPILPGKKGKIHVAYNTQGRPGKINKTVTLTSDAQQKVMTLYITGEVTPKPAEKPAEPVKG